MEIEYTLQAKEDIDYWKKSGNASILKKIRKLIETITQSPFEGIGNGAIKKDAPPAQLYNLEEDPNQQVNLYNQEPEIAASMKQSLKEVLESKRTTRR